MKEVYTASHYPLAMGTGIICRTESDSKPPSVHGARTPRSLDAGLRGQSHLHTGDGRYPDVIHTLFILGTDDIHTVRGVAPHHAWLRRLVSGHWPVVLQFIAVACRLSALILIESLLVNDF